MDAEGTRELTFEEELAALERSVGMLEGATLTLEEAIQQFESGFRAWRRCQELLKSAEQRIEVLCREAEEAGEGGDGGPRWIWKALSRPLEEGGLADASPPEDSGRGGPERDTDS